MCWLHVLITFPWSNEALWPCWQFLGISSFSASMLEKVDRTTPLPYGPGQCWHSNLQGKLSVLSQSIQPCKELLHSSSPLVHMKGGNKHVRVAEASGSWSWAGDGTYLDLDKIVTHQFPFWFSTFFTPWSESSKESRIFLSATILPRVSCLEHNVSPSTSRASQ